MRTVGSAIAHSIELPTLRRLRTAEYIHLTGRVPPSWFGSIPIDRDEPKARLSAVRNADRLIRHFRRSSLFADESLRAELLADLGDVRRRLFDDPIVELMGIEPRIRDTVVVFIIVDWAVLDRRAVRKAMEAIRRSGYSVYRIALSATI